MGPRTRSVCAERRGRRCDQGMRMMQGSDSKVYYFVPDIPSTAGCARQAESEVRQGPLGVRERQTCRDAEAMGRCSWLATGALAAAAGCWAWPRGAHVAHAVFRPCAVGLGGSQCAGHGRTWRRPSREVGCQASCTDAIARAIARAISIPRRRSGGPYASPGSR